MAFSHAEYVDARRSNFNQIGRDYHQTTIHNPAIHYHIYLSPSRSPRRPHQFAIDIADPLSLSIGAADFSPQGRPVTYSSSNAVSIIGAAIGLVDQITHLLTGYGQSSNGHRDLALELESLQRTLNLARLAIHMYDNKCLGQSLTNTITPGALQCFFVLQELLDSINGAWLDFSITSVGGLCRRIWSVVFDGDVFASSKKKLSFNRQSLQGLLMALRSVAWMELGDELSAGFVSLLRFHDLYNQRLPSLYHIKLNAVDVVSHLGQIIPIPTIFCSTWEDFDYLLQAHCRDTVGIEFIERGDYEVIRAEDNQTIGPSELASTADSGMKLEISIVMRQRMANQKKCPRCNCINSQLAASSGWTECRQCLGQFRIAEADRNNRSVQNDVKVDKECYGKLDEEHGGNGDTESGDKGIVSPAARTGGNTRQTSDIAMQQREDDNDTYDDDGIPDDRDNHYKKFFRRIHVIYTMELEEQMVQESHVEDKCEAASEENRKADPGNEERWGNKPWYLRPSYDPAKILIDPDGSVKGGTVPALVEYLTVHEPEDPIFVQTFLMTYKSFTTIDEFFKLLVQRFWTQPPSRLKPEEFNEWTKYKQRIIQIRVLNTLKAMVQDQDMFEKEDTYILNCMREFLKKEKVFTADRQVLVLINDIGGKATANTSPINLPKPIQPKMSKPLKLLDIDPLELARHLTIMESRLYLSIRPIECLGRSREIKVDYKDNITHAIQHFNQLVNWVQDCILALEDTRRRAAIIKHFITVADRCRTLKNYSSMVAIISGLNAAPVRRLKRTWELVNARFRVQFGACEVMIDPNRNFRNYRDVLAKISPPCVPYIGIFLRTLVYIQKGNRDMFPNDVVNFRKRQKAAEVINDIMRWQSQPHRFHPIARVITFMESSLSLFTDQVDIDDYFWNLSLIRESREREDEMMARALQESGFL